MSLQGSKDVLSAQQAWLWLTLCPFLTCVEYATLLRTGRCCRTELSHPVCCQRMLDRLFFISASHRERLAELGWSSVDALKQMLGPLVAVQLRCLRGREPPSLHRQLWWEALLAGPRYSAELALLQSVEGVAHNERSHAGRKRHNFVFDHFFAERLNTHRRLMAPGSSLQLWMANAYSADAFPSLVIGLNQVKIRDVAAEQAAVRRCLDLVNERVCWIGGWYASENTFAVGYFLGDFQPMEMPPTPWTSDPQVRDVSEAAECRRRMADPHLDWDILPLLLHEPCTQRTKLYLPPHTLPHLVRQSGAALDCSRWEKAEEAEHRPSTVHLRIDAIEEAREGPLAYHPRMFERRR